MHASEKRRVAVLAAVLFVVLMCISLMPQIGNWPWLPVTLENKTIQVLYFSLGQLFLALEHVTGYEEMLSFL